MQISWCDAHLWFEMLSEIIGALLKLERITPNSPSSFENSHSQRANNLEWKASVIIISESVSFQTPYMMGSENSKLYKNPAILTQNETNDVIIPTCTYIHK